MNGVTDVHGQVDGSDFLIAVEIIEADGRRRRTTGHKSVTDRTKATPEALACNLGIVDTRKLDVGFVISRDLECGISAIAANVANAVANCVVEQNSLTILLVLVVVKFL